MSVWQDKKTGKWRYKFFFDKRPNERQGFETFDDALTAENENRIKVGDTLHKNIKKREDWLRRQFGIEKITTIEELRSKYLAIYKNPQNTIGTIFNMLMADLELPVRFSDLVQSAKDVANKNRKKIPSPLRAQVLIRDKSTCQMCGRKAPDIKIHVDHIVPLNAGGLTEIRNLQCTCSTCNLGKRDMVMEPNDRNGTRKDVA